MDYVSAAAHHDERNVLALFSILVAAIAVFRNWKKDGMVRRLLILPYKFSHYVSQLHLCRRFIGYVRDRLNAWKFLFTGPAMIQNAFDKVTYTSLEPGCRD